MLHVLVPGREGNKKRIRQVRVSGVTWPIQVVFGTDTLLDIAQGLKGYRIWIESR